MPMHLLGARPASGIAMDHYERFSRGSGWHKAKVNPDSLHLLPVDGTREAIEHFQFIVGEVFAHEGDGYEIVIVSSNAEYPFDLCDAMLLKKQQAES
jgi:hypothetical protein